MARTCIDVHAHYLGGTVGEHFGPGFSPTGGCGIRAEWTAESALAFMDRHEIRAQILSVPWPFAGTAVDPGFATRFCRDINREYAELIAKYSDRFGAFAAVPLDSPEAMLTEIAYGLDELGLDGVVLTSNSRGRYFGDPWYEPVLAELDRRQVPVFLHPTDSPYAEVLGMGRPSSVCEHPFDTARNIVNALYAGVFRRYPNLNLILAHCGGALPTLGWRIAEHTTLGRGPHDADIDFEHASDVLSNLYYETALSGAACSLLPVLEVAGADRVLFGTGWPAAPEALVDRNIDNLLALGGFSAVELADVQRGNAARLFKRFA
jgi:predicted TIM-barrel fold metal-dependent hydrolase